MPEYSAGSGRGGRQEKEWRSDWIAVEERVEVRGYRTREEGGGEAE